MGSMVLQKNSPGPLIGWVVSHAAPWDAGDRLCDLVAKHQLLYQQPPALACQPVHHAAELGHVELQPLLQQLIAAHPLHMAARRGVVMDL
jgi:hypothetical protein